MGFQQNSELTMWNSTPYVQENVFISKEPERRPLPDFSQSRGSLPQPVWEGHPEVLSCYWRAWELAFSNLRQPLPGTGFVSNFIDTAFNGCTFMWDSSFILMFGKYAQRIFNFQGTLDNFYAHQHRDGFICREIDEATGEDRFTRFDPAATGPDVMGWCEWEYFKNFGDMDRLAKVFPPLLAYHEWLRINHTWRDGSYWSSGWGCGMDDILRHQDLPGHTVSYTHGHMVWNDICMQALLSGRILIEMARLLGREADVKNLLEEQEQLSALINDKLWDDQTAFYYDLWKDGHLNMVKHIGAYWSLLAGVVPEDRAERFIAHLENEKEFNLPCRIPALSADSPSFHETGGYWSGGIWAPTNYMVLKGLERYGRYALAHEIGENYLQNVVGVFEQTNTLFEFYEPTPDSQGNPRPGRGCHRDFVGWTGLAPISVLFEFVFGIKPDAEHNSLLWDIRLLEKHGIERYPFGRDATLTLLCEKRDSVWEEPAVTVRASRPVTVELRWEGGSKTIQA